MLIFPKFFKKWKISEKLHVPIMLVIAFYFVIKLLPNSNNVPRKPFMKIVEEMVEMEMQLL